MILTQKCLLIQLVTSGFLPVNAHAVVNILNIKLDLQLYISFFDHQIIK